MLSSPQEFRRGLPVRPTTAVRQPPGWVGGGSGVAGGAPACGGGWQRWSSGCGGACGRRGYGLWWCSACACLGWVGRGRWVAVCVQACVMSRTTRNSSILKLSMSTTSLGRKGSGRRRVGGVCGLWGHLLERVVSAQHDLSRCHIALSVPRLGAGPLGLEQRKTPLTENAGVLVTATALVVNWCVVCLWDGPALCGRFSISLSIYIWSMCICISSEDVRPNPSPQLDDLLSRCDPRCAAPHLSTAVLLRGGARTRYLGYGKHLL